jgi:hypothetical protein
MAMEGGSESGWDIRAPIGVDNPSYRLSYICCHALSAAAKLQP